MVNSFYPKAPSTIEPVSIDKKVEAAGFIKLMQDGMDAEYAKKFRVPADRDREPKGKDKVAGDALSKEDMIAIQLASRDCYDEIAGVYEEVIAERKALAGIIPASFKTEKEYIAELTKKAVYSVPNTWLSCMKEANGVTSWTALKAAYTKESI